MTADSTDQQEGTVTTTSAGKDMESLFDGFFKSVEALRHQQGESSASDVNAIIANISSNIWTPRIERREDDKRLTFVAHLPNVPQDQIKVDTESSPGRLKIYSECSQQSVYKHNNNDRITERQLGQFEKDIPLPDTACAQQMTVVYKGSSVIINIPKD